MSRTATEKNILERRNAKGILVPILEELLETPQQIEDEEDEQFMLELMKARAVKREKGVFSPSMLGSCVRQAYFAKTGVEKRPAKSARPNGFFIDGDFRHYKWQFLLWKAHRANMLILHGVEVRVYHPNGDFAGTIDAIIEIDGEIFIVDFKGMQVRSFQSFEQYGTTDKHKVQIVGYAVIVNKAKGFASFMGMVTTLVPGHQLVTRVILVGENKGGPGQRGSPLGLHEDVITVKSALSKVKRRMHTLREAVKNEEVPPAECMSTRINDFQQCAFAYICRDEVKAEQKRRESAKSKADLRPARPRRRASKVDR